ncbi:nucleotidyltransferase domain-containing protein [Patescibacteria group bacterium]|nr:nucleotidyltransferase domain-containing protein [Patescibacteria group bacterium]
MKEYLSIKLDEREEIIEKIKGVFSERENVVFAFVFGSFLNAPAFRDIDIGVYADKIKKDEVFDYELKLSELLAGHSDLPFDVFEVKVLNFAPNSFVNNVTKNGRLLFSKDESLLSDIIEKSSLEAIANEYIAYQSLKELIPA